MAPEILGAPVASKIRDAYVFLAQNFEVGDEICLFGFSRGAYSVRKLAGLITRANSSPPVPSLNQFEIHCMNHWRDTQTRMAPQWIRGELGLVPSNAVIGGREPDGSPLYIARASYHGIHPGKASSYCVSISYGGLELHMSYSQFDILVADARSVGWIKVKGRLSLKSLGATPVM
ncbi:hypothetical protein POSPLADRAFT_1061495 [Postia placenta MAD-698-R-SB12]|uniref:T6SS Phospholipase effector Tle1-like catalytic domain-containing protein n=1 Tax=Postia placenta MAD-698-R-SB12 TaxID=670580 RepID=A0A1X6MNI4_9APHY|nr:hypothetical protein POSPLADRAFT_1061495 [Postia placenta MAD-698-R-SB12]OSX57819.1 hypothetical protein POSPLADRAFT_1061495 [Postia placenta MAD-698-R-SB12]